MLLQAISFCHLWLCFWILSLLPPPAPGLFLSIYRDKGSLSFAFRLPLADKHSCFSNSQREAKEMQVSRTPLLSSPFDCWNKRQELEQLSWKAATLGHHSHQGVTILVPVKVKNNSLLKYLSQYSSFWNDAMKWPDMTDWLGKPSHSCSFVFTWHYFRPGDTLWRHLTSIQISPVTFTALLFTEHWQ